MRLRALVALFLIGCGGVATRAGVRPAAPAGQLERIAVRLGWLDVVQAPRKYRGTDAPAFGPYYVFISWSGHYCAVSEENFFVGPPEGTLYECRWRVPR